MFCTFITTFRTFKDLVDTLNLDLLRGEFDQRNLSAEELPPGAQRT